MVLFREAFDEVAKEFPDCESEHVYVDATALFMVRDPKRFDVMVTENMFGDILSDLGAAIMGGLGYAPSADIGDEHAVFQPCHGTAPDIAGKGLANPTAMILSAGMMLDWLGNRNGVAEAGRAGRLIRQAVTDAFAKGQMVTCELGGDAGTQTVFDAVTAALDALDPEAV
jgi:3-isopropylmalate dehydrogenase